VKRFWLHNILLNFFLLTFNILLFTFSNRALSQQSPFINDFSDRILRFHSEIDVSEDGVVHVKEHIRIYNGDGENTPGYNRMNSVYTNNDIQRGLVRDFPTKYEDSSGFWMETGFDVISVTRNGKKEDYVEDNLVNGTRLKIGNADVILETGVHDYMIEYTTQRQIIYHANKDELYWNVNGNGWVFSCDTISCVIRFPQGADIFENACYTGPEGSTASNCRSVSKNSREIEFTTTQKAEANEGLTVAAAIRKGILKEPGRFKKFIAFLSANYIIPLLIFLFLFQFVFYYVVWYKKGRDPKKGVIYPQFSPPDGVTAADAGFILDQKFDSKLFAAALIDCAVKKRLKIEVSREGLLFKSNVYHFKEPDVPVNGYSSSDEYGFALTSLYNLRAQKGKYNSLLRTCYTSLQSALRDRYQVRSGKSARKKGAFVLNKGYVTIGFIIVIAAAFFSFQFFTTHPSTPIAIFSAAFVVAMLLVHLVFRSIMSAYTKEGRQLVDHLLGFKMYLSQAEKHVYNQLAPPERTLDLFEKYLPYAIALGVENEWSSQFDDILEKALAEGYTPGYYSVSGGRMQHFTASEFSRGISSGLSSTVSSASTPPSSSRGGSSGGGRSGGGGGGGGGGGW
jgi:uncharacterized membrane protein YgcG